MSKNQIKTKPFNEEKIKKMNEQEQKTQNMKPKPNFENLYAVVFYYKGIDMRIFAKDIVDISKSMELLELASSQVNQIDFNSFLEKLDKRALELKGCKGYKPSQKEINEWTFYIYTLVKNDVLKEDDLNGVKYFYNEMLFEIFHVYSND